MFLPSEMWEEGKKMQSTVLMDTSAPGKLVQPAHAETIASGVKNSKRLHIKDRNCGMIFLIGTGSDISLIPDTKKVMSTRPSDVKLFAANDTQVLTFGGKRLTLNLGLRRSFTWNFCVAAVPDPIIGADLLTHYLLVPFLHRSSLIDTSTGLRALGFTKTATTFGLSVIGRSSIFSQILSEYSGITRMPQYTGNLIGNVQHHIVT